MGNAGSARCFFFYCLSAGCPYRRTGFIKLQVMLSLSLFANSAGVCGDGLSENSYTSWVRRALGSARWRKSQERAAGLCWSGPGSQAAAAVLLPSSALLMWKHFHAAQSPCGCWWVTAGGAHLSHSSTASCRGFTSSSCAFISVRYKQSPKGRVGVCCFFSFVLVCLFLEFL